MSCLRLLCKICGFRALLPKPLAVEVFYDRTQDPVYHGGFGDVWKGISGGLEVAVKVIRSYQSSDQGEVRKVGGWWPSLPLVCRQVDFNTYRGSAKRL